MADQVYVATQSGSSEINGEPVIFLKGVTMVAEGHPLLDAVPDYFQPVEEKAGFDTATIVHHAAPEDTTQHFDATENAIALAAAHSVDLATVTGTGTNGRITQPDVQHVIDSAPSAGEGEGEGTGEA